MVCREYDPSTHSAVRREPRRRRRRRPARQHGGGVPGTRHMVPSALTYRIRQIEDALDVLLFDRSARNARLTPAGEELLRAGRYLLEEFDAVAERVKRIATGWPTPHAVARGPRTTSCRDRTSSRCPACSTSWKRSCAASAPVFAGAACPALCRHRPSGGQVTRAQRAARRMRLRLAPPAWRRPAHPGQEGKALAWWLARLEHPLTRSALLEQHHPGQRH